jgi:leucyl/phenylalanyl-tRNA---protein transferase
MMRIPAEVLLRAYAIGIFPMAESSTSPEVNWYEPKLRGVIPMGSFRVSKNVLRLARNGPFRTSINNAFAEVIQGCADRPETWINPTILDAFGELHDLGFAHSIEVWYESKLVGGLYGVALGAVFFGESMFKRMPDTDKLALLACHTHLAERGFQLWDTQFWTAHLDQFGCIEIPQEMYLVKLAAALAKPATFG